MATLHSSLTGANLHEPKGADSASASQVYIADGAGSGTWTTDYGLNKVTLSVVIDDISTAGFVLVPIPSAMTFEEAEVVIANAITTADATLAFTRAGSASLGTDLTVAYTGSAEGSGFTFTGSSNQAISADSYIKIATDGGSSTTCRAFITLTLTRTE